MEFFGKPIDVHKEMSKNREDQKIGDELFWYIVDHDKLHKEFFHPLGSKIHKDYKANKLNKEETVKKFLPMVNKGCMEFYKHKKLKDPVRKVFPEEVRHDMCERLFDHYREDIIKGSYKLGK